MQTSQPSCCPLMLLTIAFPLLLLIASPALVRCGDGGQQEGTVKSAQPSPARNGGGINLHSSSTAWEPKRKSDSSQPPSASVEVPAAGRQDDDDEQPSGSSSTTTTKRPTRRTTRARSDPNQDIYKIRKFSIAHQK